MMEGKEGAMYVKQIISWEFAIRTDRQLFTEAEQEALGSYDRAS